jgi:hypothetical protein
VDKWAAKLLQTGIGRNRTVVMRTATGPLSNYAATPTSATGLSLARAALSNIEARHSPDRAASIANRTPAPDTHPTRA